MKSIWDPRCRTCPLGLQEKLSSLPRGFCDSCSHIGPPFASESGGAVIVASIHSVPFVREHEIYSNSLIIYRGRATIGSQVAELESNVLTSWDALGFRSSYGRTTAEPDVHIEEVCNNAVVNLGMQQWSKRDQRGVVELYIFTQAGAAYMCGLHEPQWG